jgi:hypothetical protein
MSWPVAGFDAHCLVMAGSLVVAGYFVMAGLDPAILFVPAAPVYGRIGAGRRNGVGQPPLGGIGRCRSQQEDDRIGSGHDRR